MQFKNAWSLWLAFDLTDAFYLYSQRTSIKPHALTLSDKLLLNAISRIPCARTFPTCLHYLSSIAYIARCLGTCPGGLSTAPSMRWLASSVSNQMTPAVAYHLFSQSQERNTVTPLTQWDVFIIIQSLRNEATCDSSTVIGIHFSLKDYSNTPILQFKRLFQYYNVKLI